ncbi:MAG: hypothetical protein OXT69_01220 [Candidatus Poribacteria bacterium]|nr:hypothetical protein [Candidatus Poribacteria bacterium]
MKNRLMGWFRQPENALFAALILLHLIPIWAFPYFPSQDGPAHLNNANVLREYNHPDRSVFREYYVLNSNPEPNWTGHLALAGLMFLVPLLTAEKLLLSGYVVLLPLSARYAVRAVNPQNAGLAFLSFPFIFNYLLHMGFYNFSYSLPFFFFVVGYWAKKQERFGWREALIMALLWLALYFTHIFSVVTACAAIGLAALMFTAFDLVNRLRGVPPDGETPKTSFWRLFASRALVPFIALLPTALLVLNFLNQKGVRRGEPLPVGFQWRRLRTLESLVSFHDYEVWLAISVAALFAALTAFLLLVKVLRWEWNRWDALLIVSAAYVYIYFIAPDWMSGGGFISHRMILFPYIALLLWAAGQRWPVWSKRTAQAAAAALAVAFLALNMRSYAQLNEYLEEYISAGDHVEPNTTLLPLCFSHQGRDENDRIMARRIGPFLHASGIIAAKKRIVEMDNYEGNTTYFPVLFRPEKNPFTHIGAIEAQPPQVDFLSFNEKTGGTVDYVLLWQLRDLYHENAQKILEQLDKGGYERIFVSEPRGAAQLYRRPGLKTGE